MTHQWAETLAGTASLCGNAADVRVSYKAGVSSVTTPKGWMDLTKVVSCARELGHCACGIYDVPPVECQPCLSTELRLLRHSVLPSGWSFRLLMGPYCPLLEESWWYSVLLSLEAFNNSLFLAHSICNDYKFLGRPHALLPAYPPPPMSLRSLRSPVPQVLIFDSCTLCFLDRRWQEEAWTVLTEFKFESFIQLNAVVVHVCVCPFHVDLRSHME